MNDVAAAVRPGTIQVWSDLLCPFAYVGLLRLRRTRARLGVDVAIEHRSFPLELFNGPHPRRGTDTEAVGLSQIEPDAGFRVWTAADDLYPHTVLLAAEAVYAAAAQGPRAAEELDLALRVAFWVHSRSIAHRQVILDIAGGAARRTARRRNTRRRTGRRPAPGGPHGRFRRGADRHHRGQSDVPTGRRDSGDQPGDHGALGRAVGVRFPGRRCRRPVGLRRPAAAGGLVHIVHRYVQRRR